VGEVPTTEKLDAVLFMRDGRWVAQFLQYDIGAEAGKLEELDYEIQRVLVGYICTCLEHGETPFARLQPAPKPYWDLWRRSRLKLVPDPGPAFRTATGTVQPPLAELKIASGF
jgi:hypothetical protein